MANFFSADYWKALYFKAMGGQETAVDPNAMSGSFAGSASFTGTASSTGSSAVDIAGSFAGSSTFNGDLGRIGTGYRGHRPTLGELRDAFFDRLRGRKKRKRDEEDEQQVAPEQEPAPGIPPIAARTPEQIEELAAEIAARLEARAATVAPEAKIDSQAFGRSGLFGGLTLDGLSLDPQETAQAEIEAAIAQAEALSLMADLKRKQDEEDLILVLLLAA